jgi:hypothetical protein
VPTSERPVAGGRRGSYGRLVRQIAVIIVTLSLIAAGGTIAVATGGGGHNGGSDCNWSWLKTGKGKYTKHCGQGNPSHHQYKKKKLCWLVAKTAKEFKSVCEDKPGCGPDKTDGVAGNSGRHTGQPPKQPNRQDCPHAPPHA